MKSLDNSLTSKILSMLDCPVLWKLFAFLLLGYFISGSESCAQTAQSKSPKQTKKEPTRKTDKGSSPSSTAESFAKAENDIGHEKKDDKNRKKAVTAGAILLVGVLMLGFFSIILILVWGRTTRWMAKSRGSKQTVIDPLWYLKSRKKEESASPGDGQNDSDRFDSTQA